MTTVFPAALPHAPATCPQPPLAAGQPVRRLVWLPEPLPLENADVLPAGRRVLLLGADDGLRSAVAAQLEADGVTVVAGGPDGPPAGTLDGIVDLNLTGVTGPPSGRRWRAALTESVLALQHVHEDWAAESRHAHHFYLAVTCLGGLMGYDRTVLPQPLGGIWSGLAKGLQYELPTVSARVVDVDVATSGAPPALAAVIRRECAATDAVEVGHHDGVRRTLVGRPAEVAPPGLDLGRDDTVLITGGGRGIGFAIAEELARRTGCRVVVTGRAAAPGDQPWQALDDEGFARWRREELKAAAGKDAVRATRRRLSLAAQQREVRGNLRRAGEGGLRIDYQPCDCTDPQQVRALLDRIGEQPTVLIHNAGTDQSRRFADQSPEDFADTVAVKVDGLLTMVDELRGRPGSRLRLVSGVGSLAGRVGGMVGQVAYSAGNDALARLGHWISAESGIPAQTTVWHTWAGPGGLANPRTAARYTSLVDPRDGVRHWAREILSGASGEAVFMGRYGNAVLPHQLWNRMPWVYDADYPRWAGARHHLGDVRSFQVHSGIECDNRLLAGDHPCFDEYTIDRNPALPVSVLLEYAFSVGDWVGPHGWPPQSLREVSAVSIQLDSLAFRNGELLLRKQGRGAERDDGRWTVTVRVTLEDGTPVLSAELVYDDEAAEITPPQAVADRSVPPMAPDAAGRNRHRWRHHLFDRPARRIAQGGGQEFALRPVASADLWALPHAPHPRIDPAVLETIAQILIAEQGDGAERLLIGRLAWTPEARRVPTLLRSPHGSDWLGTTGDGDPVVLVSGAWAGPLS